MHQDNYTVLLAVVKAPTIYFWTFALVLVIFQVKYVITMYLHFRCSSDGILSWIRARTVGHTHIVSKVCRPLRVISCRTMAYMTYFLTPCTRVLLEKLTGFQLVKKFPAFYGSRRFITVVTSARLQPLSWAISIQFIPTPPTSWRSILCDSRPISGTQRFLLYQTLNAASLDTNVDTTSEKMGGARGTARFKFAVLVLWHCSAGDLDLLLSCCSG